MSSDDPENWKPRYVVAPTCAQAREFGERQGWPLSALRHITDPNQLRGLERYGTLHVVGNQAQIPNYYEIANMAITRDFKIRYADNARS